MRYTSLKSLVVVAAGLLGLSSMANRANAAFVFSIQQVGSNVVTTGSGTINTVGLTSITQGVSARGLINTSVGLVDGGPSSSTTCENASGLTGGQHRWEAVTRR